MQKFTLAQLAKQLNAQLEGDPQATVTNLATLDTAKANSLSFLSNPKLVKQLATTQAGALLVHPKQAAAFSGNKLLVANPYLAYAQATHLFAKPKPAAGQIHPTAVVHSSVTYHPSVHIGPYAVVEENTQLEEGVIVGAHSYIGANCFIGANTRLHPRVTLYRDVTTGADCILHSGCVIGSDGFGNAPTGEDWLKIEQLGGVELGDKVEVGANTTIDCGALGNTKVHRDVKLDNLIHLAHNCEIGAHTAMASQVGISGSTKIGENCMFGGQAGIAGHIEIADNAHFTGQAMVTGSIKEAGAYSSGTSIMPNAAWRKNVVRFRNLNELALKVRELEKQLAGLLNAE